MRESSMRKSLIFTILAMVILLAPVLTVQAARAQQTSDRLTLVAIDRYSISSGDANHQLLDTFLGLLVNLKDGERLAFAFTDDMSDIYGPLDTDAAGFAELQSQALSAIGSGSATAPVELASALSAIHSRMAAMNAGEEASVYLVSASGDYPGSDQFAGALTPIIAAGWSVFTATTPGTNDALASDLSEISAGTGGESFALSVPDGFESMVDRLMRMEGRGAISALGSANLSDDPVFEVGLDIVPSTRRAKVLFFREDPQTSFRITNPDGAESSDGDRTDSSIAEFPHLVIWEVTEPVAGRWQAEVRGDGVVSVNMDLTNRYSIRLQRLGSVPVGYPETVIVAAVLDGGRPFSPDAQVTAIVTDPAGNSITHDLNDAGVQGDAIPKDGFFSLTLPPVNAEGKYAVELRMTWPDLAHSVTSRAEFEAQNFPTLRVTPDMVEGLKPGVPAKVASVSININGQPFTALAEELSVAVSEIDGAPAGEITKHPQEMITEGKAHVFDIYFTPNSESRSALVFGLNIEYADRQYIYSTDSLTVSSLPASAPAPAVVQPAPTVAPPPPAPVQPAPTAAPPPAPPAQPEQPDNAATISIPIEIIIIALAAIGIAALAIALYWLTRPTPFGYLYTEEGGLLVDFGAIVRRPVDKLMKRSRIDGDELELPGFGGVSFVFGSDTVTMVSIQVLPNTVRVNNQPVTDTMPIHDNSMIGASGRLYFFRYLPQTTADPEDESAE